MTAWVLDEAGFVTGTYDGPGAAANSTLVPPPADASQPLQFVRGAWVTAAQPPVSWADAPAEYWWIDVGPFFDRFGGKAIVVTSSEDNVVRGMLALLTPRKYVDLKRADLPVLLDVLVKKQLLTAADVDAILNTPTTDYERYVKGLPQPAGA